MRVSVFDSFGDKFPATKQELIPITPISDIYTMHTTLYKQANRAKNYLVLTGLLLVIVWGVPAEETPVDLQVGTEDLLVEQGKEGGYHLWVRSKGDIGSVLITESTADPELKEPVYALRNPDYHPVNGDEKRVLDGEFLDLSKGIFSLIDSTPEIHSDLGDAYHVYLPYVVVFGYPWSRQGEIQVLDGSYLNIRTFVKPFADYSGGFTDNPFVLRIVQRPLEGPPEENYMAETLDDYREIAEEGGGEAILSTGEEDILEKLSKMLAVRSGESLDLVLALDTTESMKNDMPHLRESLMPLLEDATTGFNSFRFGMVLYKDYMDQYVTRVMPFQPDLSQAQKVLDGVRVFGGRDIPEAVYEALYAGIHEYDWDAEAKMIILIGDAPAHPKARGSVTREMVYTQAQAADIELHAIILPQ